MASVLASGVSSTATADYYDAVVHQYWIQPLDFGGASVSVYVQDVYLLSDDAWEGTTGSGDTLLNVFNWNTVDGAPTSFFQSFTGIGWLAQNSGGPFDNDALQTADSFVTIGGFGEDVCQTPGAGAGSGLDPNFGGNGAAGPGTDAGWFNGSPPKYNGAAMVYDVGTLGTLIGRFSSTTNPGSLVGTTFRATWNQGLGTEGQQASFTITDAIGSFDCNQNGVPDDIDLENGVLADCDGDGTADECQIPIPIFESPTLACPLAGETIVVQIEIEDGPLFGVFDSTLFLDIAADLNGPDRYLDIAVGDEDQVTTRIERDGDCDGGIASVLLPGFNAGWGDGAGVPLTITASSALAAACDDTIRARVHGPLIADCDGDGLLDSCEIADGSEIDCDGDGRIDRCFTPDAESGDDCDGDGVLDACEIADGALDCNGNGIPDTCDLADGTSTDYDADGLPDECEPTLVVGDGASTIAEAIAAIPDGGFVIVPAGEYAAPFALDRAVTVMAPDGPESTVLSNGGAPQTIVTAHGATTGAALIGFTITDGVGAVGEVGGGIDAIDSFLRVEDCVLRGNFGTDGGGARFQGGAPAILGCVFESNLSGGTGGGLRLVDTDATVDRCRFHANEAGDAYGLALAVTDGMVSLIDLEVSAHDGQAVSFADTDGDGSVVLAGSTIRDNLEQGVAITADDDSYAAIADTRICGNTVAPIAGPYTDGGGNVLLVDRCPDLVVPDDADTIQLAIDTTVDGERIAVRPGTYDEPGLALGGRDLEIVAVPGADPPTIIGPVVAGGEPSTALLRGFELRDGIGRDDLPGLDGIVVGGNLVLDQSGLVVEGCRIDGGLAEFGGGIFVRGGEGSLVDCYITANRATEEGGGIFVDGSSAGSFSIENCIIAGNLLQFEPATRGGGLRVSGTTTVVKIEGVAICSNDRENLAGEVTRIGSNSICLAFDCDTNGVEDAADIGDFGRPDCNGNLVPDDCDIADGSEADCDGNNVPDACDLANGAPDLDQDGILDSCQDQLVFQVPDRFSTIEAAIASATEGSRIQLSAAGSPYVERVDFGLKNLELVGDPADPASVVVDAFDLDATVITIAGGQDSSTRIAGILVKQGIADTPEPGSPTNLVGGGFYIDGADPIIEDCIIADNQATRGGGAYLRSSEAVFRRTTIQSNDASGGGAGLWWSDGVVRLEDCDILDNQSEVNGGGLRATAGAGTIIGGSFAGNFTLNDGGGLWWQGSTQALAIEGVVITGNIAGEVGGGIKTRYGYPGVTLADSTLCDNAPDQLDGIYTDLGGNELCVCPADLNGDGVIGGEDIGLYLAYAGSDCEPFTPCPGDVTNDGVINGADLGKILGAWGLCP